MATTIRAGHQLRRPDTIRSYVLVSTRDDDLDVGQVFQNQTAIPNAGEFEDDALHTDAAGAGLPRFSDAPGGNLGYCNGVESCIWAGEEMRCGAFFTVSSAALADPIDYTDEISNTLSTSGEVAPVGVATSQERFLIFSTRPLQGAKLYVATANTTTSTLTVTQWTGAAFGAVTGFTDNTASGGITVAQTGTVVWDSTVSTAKRKHFQGLYLFCYLFEMSAGDAEISHVTVDAPFQPIVDNWDGVYRQPVQFQYEDAGSYKDYTLEVNESSYALNPLGAVLTGFGTADHIVVMFEERMAAIRWQMIAGKVNAVAASCTISYWSGTAYTSVGTVTDGTMDGTATIGQTGLMSWTPPDEGSEHKINLFGITGYAYKVTISATVTADTTVDVITGIPAPLKVPAFTFAAQYKTQNMLFGYSGGKEGNRVDFSAPNAPDSYNGSLSSADGLQSLYFGGIDDIVAASQLYNRFGANIFSTLVVKKKNETYLLTGNSPEDYRIYTISLTIGIAAPMTQANAEIGYEVSEGAQRNISIWLSYSGPVIFDGTVMYPIQGLENFFNPANDECINFDAIENAHAKYDATRKEYNLWIPSGSGQTTCNKWLVYNLEKRRAFEKDPNNTEMPQSSFQVIDTNGARYLYGSLDTGYVVRLENGPTWDGEPIRQTVTPGDFLPTGNIWHDSKIRWFKFVAMKIDEDATVRIRHYTDGSTTHDKELTTNLNEGTGRLVNYTKGVNLNSWMHRFSFITNTSETTKGFQPLFWGVKHAVRRVNR